MSIFYENEDDYKEAHRIMRKSRDVLGKASPEMENDTRDKDRMEKAGKMVAHHVGKDYNSNDEKDAASAKDIHAIDAADRHLRKHPQHEFTSIFY